MGIQVEFNPDLALRNISFFENGEREENECIPKNLEIGKRYSFLKKGQRLFYFLDDEPIPLLETKGNGILSKPIAATHFNLNGEVRTKGFYLVEEILDESSNNYFNGFQFTNKN